MRKRALEIALSGLSDLSDPRPELEQYSTPAGIASEVLHIADGMGLVKGKNIIDLGCGPGIFMIGAGLMGASSMTGVDIDTRAIASARDNIRRIDVEYGTELESISTLKESDVMTLDRSGAKYDTAFMNPPFGAQHKGADRPFLDAAMDLSFGMVTLHNARGSDFVRKKISDRNWNIILEERYRFPIRHRFHFHTRESSDIEVMLFVSTSPDRMAGWRS